MTRWFALSVVSLFVCAGCAQQPSVPSGVTKALNAPEAARAAATATNDQSAAAEGDTESDTGTPPAPTGAPDADRTAPARPDGGDPPTPTAAASASDEEKPLDPKVEAEIKKLKDEIERVVHATEGDPYEKVIPLLHRIEQLDPHDIDAFLDEAWQHYSHGQGTPQEKEFDRKAVSVYQRAMSKNPKDDRIPWEYGFLFHYKHRKDFAAGTVWMEKACRLTTDSQYPRILGGLYEMQKRKADACRMYALALKLDPNDIRARQKADNLGCNGK